MDVCALVGRNKESQLLLQGETKAIAKSEQNSPGVSDRRDCSRRKGDKDPVMFFDFSCEVYWKDINTRVI